MAKPASAAKRPSKATAKKPQKAARKGTAGRLSVRMYRGLLGDFFFLKHTVGARSFKMLIDCGVLQCIGSKESKPVTALGKDRIIAGISQLMQETGGELDLVVATHEHYDHLSGFILGNKEFEGLEIAKVWMAWTEDRGDKLANKYRNKKNKALTALAALASNAAFADKDEIKTVENLLHFYGGIDTIRAHGPGMGMSKGMGMGGSTGVAGDGKLPGNASCETVLEWLRRKAGTGNVTFLEPGDVVRWGVDDAFRAYVLGPPREDDMLRKLDPSKGEKSEVYLARGEDVETVSALAAIHSAAVGQARLDNQPFVRSHWRRYGVNGDDADKAIPAKAVDAVVQRYEADQERRIDTEFLGSAESLALKIDGDVNNTSLALALELADKKVLLFPGDAQVGNWLSWGSQDYPADDRKDGPRVKVEQLLARTVLYKVGHHASHNATLQERGLELMTDAQLCAMIPVVEDTAREQKTRNAPKGWAMPYDKLYTRLNELADERILRGDGDIAKEKKKFADSIFKLAFGENVGAKDPLWVELSLDV